MSAYSFAKEEGRAMSISRATRAIEKRPVEVLPNVPRPACPALRDDETGCQDGDHFVQNDVEYQSWYYDRLTGQKVARTLLRNATRDCPLKRYQAERRRLDAQLSLCGYGADRDGLADPIGPALGKLLDSRRDVAGLDDLIAAVAELIQRGPRAAGHAAFVGTVGTAKTHVLLLLYFTALW